MGALQVKEKKSKKNEKPVLLSYDVKKIYWDGDGNLRHGFSERKRDEEVLRILEADTNSESDPERVWMIVPSRWVRLWLQFAYLKLGEPPGPIDMWSLLQKDPKAEGGWRPKSTLKPPHSKFGEVETPGHYRRVTLQVWLKLLDLYGLEGYAMAVRGIPVDDLTRWRVFKDPRYIDVNLLPEPIIPKEPEKKDNVVTSAAKSLLSSVGISFGQSSKPDPKAVAK